MEYYQISFYSEYYKRDVWFEIDEENEQKISSNLEGLVGTRNSFAIDDLDIDLIDNDVSAFLTRAIEHRKVSFYNTSISHILYGSDHTRLVKKYDLGRMLIKSFRADKDNKLSSLSVVFNHGNDILKNSEDK